METPNHIKSPKSAESKLRMANVRGKVCIPVSRRRTGPPGPPFREGRGHRKAGDEETEQDHE